MQLNTLERFHLFQQIALLDDRVGVGRPQNYPDFFGVVLCFARVHYDLLLAGRIAIGRTQQAHKALRINQGIGKDKQDGKETNGPGCRAAPSTKAHRS